VRKNFPLRIDSEVLDGIRRWADDDLRSLNAQIEFVLRDALRQKGRIKAESGKEGKDVDEPDLAD
jgi:hypothetical protein